MNNKLSEFSNLVGLIYEGTTDPNRRAKDIFPAVDKYIQLPECIPFTNLHTPQNGECFSCMM